MITVPTHKRHESPFKHSKTIYVFTSGPVIVTVQIHSELMGPIFFLFTGGQRGMPGVASSACAQSNLSPSMFGV
jgi:hypothetical protein